MHAPELRLVVVRTASLDRMAEFLRWLELAYQFERHGTGPLHLAVSLGTTVLEYYPVAESTTADATTRLGLAVPHLDAALDRLRTNAVEMVAEHAETPWGRRAVVRDPDGRSVELYQAHAAAEHAISADVQTMLDRIAVNIHGIYDRTRMYVGSDEAYVAADCLLYSLHRHWVEAAHRFSELSDAFLHVVTERKHPRLSDIPSAYREMHPDATARETMQYVLECWREVSRRLRIPNRFAEPTLPP